MVDESVYWSPHDILSRNAAYNFVCGARGVGKTFAAKRIVINNFLKNRKQFIYVRRYRSEVASAAKNFFNDIAEYYPQARFRYNNGVFECATDAKAEHWETMGYPVSLSKSQQLKSVAYPDVTWIIFDEFIIGKGHIRYLPNETNVFNDFYLTVDRYMDKTRVLFISNSVSIMCPYITAYDLQPNGQRFMRRHNGFIACEYVDSTRFTEVVNKSKFGRFIEKTDYSRYAVKNEFLDNGDTLLGRKPEHAYYVFTVVAPTGKYSVWRGHEGDTARMWVQKKRPGNEAYVTFTPALVSDDVPLIPSGSDLLSIFRTSFSRGDMRFSTATVRNDFVKELGYS